MKRIASSFLLCFMLLFSCASMIKGPTVPLTQEQTNIINVQAYEDTFMNIYRSAHDYVVINPKYAHKWNTIIQPLFSSSHRALILYEMKLLTGSFSASQVSVVVEDLARDAINAMRDIGWIKPAVGGK